MNYKPNVIAKMLGITTEGLRYYEKKGIIQVDKEEQARYAPMDLNVLMRCRIYRGLGFSLSEVDALVNGLDVSDIQQQFTTKQAEIEHEILLAQKKIRALQLLADGLEGIAKKVGQCFVEEYPAFYYLEYRRMNELLLQPETMRAVKEWMAHAEFVIPTGRLAQCALHGTRGQHIYMGLGMREEFYTLLHLPAFGFVQYVPEQTYVSVVMHYKNGAPFDLESIPLIREYLHAHGLTCTQDGYFQTMMATHRTKEHNRYNKIMFPVEGPLM
ncbi:MerR family transcriptional regulator [Christensenellaceae bacterium OttesenSCG-928-M15]|nr:MerR family transcriptional regulator [Christensenellaceae bacterium OttesenSCG-928-M15]